MKDLINKERYICASPSSIYHKLHGEKVTIVNSFEYKKDTVYVFYHDIFGYGALYEHGFTEEVKTGLAYEYNLEESRKKKLYSLAKGVYSPVIGKCEGIMGETVHVMLHSQVGFVAGSDGVISYNPDPKQPEQAKYVGDM